MHSHLTKTTPSCPNGKNCITDSDCTNDCSQDSNTCYDQSIEPEPSCFDGFQNQDEEEINVSNCMQILLRRIQS